MHIFRKNGSTKLRVAAASVLEGLGDANTVTPLLEATSADDPDVAKAARSTLARFGGKEIDADLLNRMEKSSGKTRRVLIELIEPRRIDIGERLKTGIEFEFAARRYGRERITHFLRLAVGQTRNDGGSVPFPIGPQRIVGGP